MSEPLTLETLPPHYRFALHAMLCSLAPIADSDRDEMQRHLAIDAFLAIGPRDALEAMWAA
jgi:hypothetical protein